MSPDTESHLRRMLTRHEGLRLKPYVDTVGKLTIGVGRNLTDVGISKAESDVLLDNDIDKAIAALLNYWWFSTLDEVRQAALVDMVFNLGPSGFAGFHDFIHAMADERYADAARAGLDSKWARQVGDRAVELMDMVHTGIWGDVA